MQRRIVRVFPLGEEDGVPYAIKKNTYSVVSA